MEMKTGNCMIALLRIYEVMLFVIYIYEQTDTYGLPLLLESVGTMEAHGLVISLLNDCETIVFTLSLKTHLELYGQEQLDEHRISTVLHGQHIM